MKSFRSAFLILGISVAMVTALLALNPFERLSAALDKAFGAPPKWTQVENLYQNPDTQDLSHGDNPLPGLKRLASYWTNSGQALHICFIGNSQMQTMSLALGEPAPSGPEQTYVDQIPAAYEAQAHRSMRVYRLSAPGMSYSEALWYADYFSVHPDLKPDALVVQINYQAFWRDGIRDGMLAMLSDDEFRARITEEANAGRLYSAEFKQALDTFNQRAAHSQTSSGGEHATFADRMEKATRKWLSRSSAFRKREEDHDALFDFLYRARLYILRVKPTDARSISGVHLMRSQAALDRVAEVCKERGIRLVLFQAPLNPRVVLFRTADDRNRYHDFINKISADYGLKVYNLEEKIPAEDWGRLLNGPDPLHLGRKGHQIMAQTMSGILMQETQESNRAVQ